jgi:hypothetical protein
MFTDKYMFMFTVSVPGQNATTELIVLLAKNQILALGALAVLTSFVQRNVEKEFKMCMRIFI